MLKGWALQMEMPKYRNKKTKGEKWVGSTCSWTIKDIVREKASISYMEKGIRIL